MNPSKIVREFFTVFDIRNREAAELILAEDFTFSSPFDDHMDRQTYFARCWPEPGDHIERKIWKVFEDGSEVYVTYECTRADGTTYRNTEFFHLENDRIRHVEVFFGRDTRKFTGSSELPLLVAAPAMA